jgi:hypothetical protein
MKGLNPGQQASVAAVMMAHDGRFVADIGLAHVGLKDWSSARSQSTVSWALRQWRMCWQ